MNPAVMVDARPVEIVGGNLESDITAELKDGTRITVTMRFTEIAIIEGQKDAAGGPMYNIDTAGNVTVKHPGDAA